MAADVSVATVRRDTLSGPWSVTGTGIAKMRSRGGAAPARSSMAAAAAGDRLMRATAADTRLASCACLSAGVSSPLLRTLQTLRDSSCHSPMPSSGGSRTSGHKGLLEACPGVACGVGRPDTCILTVGLLPRA